MEASLENSVIAASLSLVAYAFFAYHRRGKDIKGLGEFSNHVPIIFAVLGPLVALGEMFMYGVFPIPSMLETFSLNGLVVVIFLGFFVIAAAYMVGAATAFSAGVMFLVGSSFLQNQLRSRWHLSVGFALYGGICGALATWAILWDAQVPKISNLVSIPMFFAGFVPGAVCALFVQHFEKVGLNRRDYSA